MPRVPAPTSPSARLLVRLARPLERLGRRAWSHTPEQLMARARAATGLEDFGGDEFVAPIQRLIDSAYADGDLTVIGRIALRNALTHHLSMRLRILELLRRHPEIAEIPIRDPVFVAGWHRTGTTVAHRMLALDPKTYAPPWWALQFPCPRSYARDEDRAWSRASVARDARAFRWISPGFSALHELEPDEPEECQFLMDNFLPVTWYFSMQAMGYGRWILAQELPEVYRFYALQLRILLWQHPAERLVLKWPLHLWFLGDLLRQFPDARVVYTHRDPVSVLPSVCALARACQTAHNHTVDPEALGPYWLELNALGAARAAAARAQAPAGQVVDLHHARFSREPLAELRRVYAAVDLPWTTAVEEAARVRATPHHSQRRLTLEEFGLDAGGVRAGLAAYLSQFGEG